MNRYEIRKIIKKCFEYGLTLTETKQTVRARIRMYNEEKSHKYGW